jgi:hypothetical protein
MIPQGYADTVAWDLSSIDEAKRQRPTRIELSWRIASAEDRPNPNGRGPGRPFGADVYLDNIRLDDDQATAVYTEVSTRVTQLVAEHGTYVYEFEEGLDAGEAGLMVFHDGTEVPVVIELADGIRLQIGDSEYRLGGDGA